LMAEVPTLRFADLENAAPGIVAGITTRSSDGPSGRGSELDFGLSTGGDPVVVSRRYERLGESLGFDAIAAVRQVHGATCLTLDGGAGGFAVAGEADGLVTDGAGLLLTVGVADCVPVFVVDPGGEAIALLHAGWRGTAANILRAGLDAVVRLSGRAVADLNILFGPSICGSCYEVGPEVEGRFKDPGGLPGHVDLRHVLERQAIALGARGERVRSAPECTRCESGRLHSHRADGARAGRMAAFLGRRP
jgi:YfiH family protein